MLAMRYYVWHTQECLGLSAFMCIIGSAVSYIAYGCRPVHILAMAIMLCICQSICSCLCCLPGCLLLPAQADHAKQCQRESIVASHAAVLSSSGGSGAAAAAAGAAPAGGSSWHDPAFAALYKDPGDLSLKEGQTIR